jgi:predicted RNA-binding protein
MGLNHRSEVVREEVVSTRIYQPKVLVRDVLGKGTVWLQGAVVRLK